MPRRSGKCHRARRERTQRSPSGLRRALVTAMQRFEARVAHSGQLLSALSYAACSRAALRWCARNGPCGACRRFDRTECAACRSIR